MNDGRLGSLVKRAGLMVLLFGMFTVIWPYVGAQAAALGGNTMESMAMAGPDQATAAYKQQETKEVQEALERIRVKPFEHLDLSQLETHTVTATGYTAGYESTGKSPGHPEYGITFSGVRVRKDDFSTIAADPKVFPIGTIMYVPGYGFGVVADTGGAIKGSKIDLYYPTKKQVYQEWGKRKVTVYVLKRGEGRVTEAMLNQLNSITKAVAVDRQMDGAEERALE